jgi:uncharacterized protein YggE
MKSMITALMILTALLAITPDNALAEDPSPAVPAAQLSVRGTSVLEFPADQLQMSLGVETVAETAQQALGGNAERLASMEKALRNAGLEKGEYRTGRFQVYPEWTPPPRQPAEDWRPAIIGYRAVGTLLIRTGKIELAGKFMETAIGAGAGTIDAVIFDLADPRAYRQLAIEAATGNARVDAKALAEAAGVRLGRVLSVQLDETAPTPRRMEMARMTDMMKAGAPPELVPGLVPVSAGVSLTYEIFGGDEN